MDDRPDLLLFVHGLLYQDRIYKRLLATPLEGVETDVFVYGHKKWDYLFRADTAKKLTRELHLKLVNLRKEGRFRSINILAHSLGTQVTMGTLALYPELDPDTVFLAAAIVSPDLELPADRPATLFVNYVSDDDTPLRLLPALAPVLNAMKNLPVSVGAAGVRGFSRTGRTVFNRLSPRSGHDSARNPSRLRSDIASLLPGRPRREVLQRLVTTRDTVLRGTLFPGEPSWRHHSIIPKGMQPVVHKSSRAPDRPVAEQPREAWRERRGFVFVEGAAGAGKTTAMMGLYVEQVERLLTNNSAAFLPVWVTWAREGGKAGAAAQLDTAARDLPHVADKIQLFIDGLDEGEVSPEDWRDIGTWSQRTDVAAVWAAARSERALEAVPSDIREAFDDHIVVLGLEEQGARKFLQAPSGDHPSLAAPTVDRILQLELVRSGHHYNPLRLLMARLIFESEREADTADLTNPHRFYAAYIDLVLDRAGVGAGQDRTSARVALGVLGASHQLRSGGAASAAAEGRLRTAWAATGKALQRCDFLLWAPDLSGADFKHSTFGEQAFVEAAFEPTPRALRQVLFDLLIRTPMHESLAAFVKGKLALASGVQRRDLASELEARTLALLDADGSDGPDTALRLNGLIYIGSRLGDVWHVFLARLWEDHRDTVLRLSPEAFVTLLSGSSLLGLIAVEEAYLGLLPEQADLRRVLVGWHLVYFGDREKPSDLAFGREALVYGGDGDWSRTRARLETRMRSLEPRDSLLFAFDAAAYLSCASLLSPESYGAAGAVVAEHLEVRRLPPARLSALRQLIAALGPPEE